MKIKLYHVCLRQSVNKTAHSGIETQRRRHQKSKTGVSVTPQKWARVQQIVF